MGSPERSITTQRYQDYATAICLTLGLLPWAAIDRTVQLLVWARRSGGRTYVVGTNGGRSAADHITRTLNRLAGTPQHPDHFVGVEIDCGRANGAQGYVKMNADAVIDEIAQTIAVGDVVIVVALSPLAPCLHGVLRIAHVNRAFTIVWAQGGCEGLSEYADVAVTIPNERPDQAELTYQVVAYMVADAIHALESRAASNHQIPDVANYED